MNVTLSGQTYTDVTVRHENYGDGCAALSVYDDHGLVVTASVHLGEHPAPGHIWVKDWSENEGILDSLVAAGVIETTGRIAQSGFVTAHEARVVTA